MNRNSEIQRIERFRFDGREFGSLGAVAEHVENEIGRIIDDTGNRLRPVDRLAVFEAIVTNRARLVSLLTANYVVDDTELQAESRNILDFNKKRGGR